MERPAMVATGVPQLDVILGGGIVQHSLLMLSGPPGSGKTVLASQIMAAAVGRGESVLLVTAYSEPQAKLIAQLQSFSFFQPEALGQQIKLLNLQYPLRTGLGEAADTLVREVRERRASVVVLDGLGGALLGSAEPMAGYRFMYDLSAKLGLLGATVLITYELAPGAELIRPELTAVDSIVALSQEHAAAVGRSLRVVKHRGAAPLLGYHHFRIDSGGVRCFPKLEALAGPGDVDVEHDRAPFGVPLLDAAMSGGPNRATSTLLLGPASAAKQLALRWLLHELQAGGHACWLSLREPERRLLAGAAAAGVELGQAAGDGRLRLRSYHGAVLLPDQLAYELLAQLQDGPRRRVLIDGAEALGPPLAAEGRERHFWVALLAELRARGATTLVVDRERDAAAELGTLCDNQLYLSAGPAGSHVVVRDMRFSAFDRQAVALEG